MTVGSAELPVADLWFFNVGQGDCTVVIDHGSQQAVLIDCPPRYTEELYAMMVERNFAVHSAIVTHWDLDHYGGIANISKVTRPRNVYYNHDTLFTDPEQRHKIKTTLLAFLDLAQLGTKLHSLRYEDELEVGSVKIRFLAPTQEEVTKAYVAGKRNIASAVVSIEVGPTRTLIGGDAVASTWERLLGSTEDLSADFLRWPHHGAKLHGDRKGIAERVFTEVQPQRVIITAGFGNPYQHPDKDVILSATKQGAYVACTQVTAKCFGFHTKEEQSATAARTVLSAVTHPACAGTIRVAVMASSVSITPSGEAHLQSISQWPKPLCKGYLDTENPAST